MNNDIFNIQPDELMHYGRKGMKWYQSIFGDKSAKVGKRTKSGKKLTKQQRKSLQAMKAGKIKAARERERKAKYLKSPTLLMKHRDEFSKEEIDKAMAQFRWEADLSRLSQQELDRGRQYANTIISYVETGTRGYNSFARIYNVVNKPNKPLPIIGEKEKEKKDDKKN